MLKRFMILIFIISLCFSSTSTFAMSSTMSESERLKILNDIKGREMSYLKYYELVYPEILQSLNPQQKDSLKNIPFPWDEVLYADGNISTRGVGGSKSYIVQYADRKLKGNSTTRYVGSEAVTFISIQCFIIDGSGNIVATGSGAKANSKSCSASATLSSPTKGKKYKASGTHVVTFGPGVTPTSSTQSTSSAYYTAK